LQIFQRVYSALVAHLNTVKINSSPLFQQIWKPNFTERISEPKEKISPYLSIFMYWVDGLYITAVE
jgi:hypothetical protein